MWQHRSSSDGVRSSARLTSNRTMLIVLAVVAVVLLLISRADERAMDDLSLGVSQAFSGVLSALTWPVRVTGAWIGDAGGMLDAHRENEALRAELAELKAYRQEALAMRYRLSRYEALLGLQVDPDIDYVSGRVISETGIGFSRTMLINVGVEQGVASGQAVVDGRGLIGVVRASSSSVSRILKVTALDSHIPVKVGPDGERAILSGQNQSLPVLRYLGNPETVEPGTIVFTSGDDGLLPQDIPVGEVIRAGPEPLVRWFADDGRIDYVRVLRFIPMVLGEVPDRALPVPSRDLPPPLVRSDPAEDESGEAETADAPAAAPAQPGG